MFNTENTFLGVLLLVGMGFQVRMWRERASKTLGANISDHEQTRRSFYSFGILFCCAIEALAGHTFATSRDVSTVWAVIMAVSVALICLLLTFTIAHIFPGRKVD